METHMRLTPGLDAVRALCHPDTTGPLVTDPHEVTCEECRWKTSRIIAEQEREQRQIEAEYDC